ncbi:glycosyltransferase [Halomonas sp. GXIMD04776]|uniref:glycosyltransferase n=1 Tax=Halomonas sp. GXIMD04776 TaxID=3415605 RepID=UPI003CC4C33A
MTFSVLISVYHRENPEYLRQAINSIWDDQALKPNQIVLVKDGPLTFDLNAVVQDWTKRLDEVMTIVELPQNVGLGAALNAGLKQCRHELVARMDTDDIALPERFEKQVSFMESNPDIAASSAILEEWDENFNSVINIRYLPENHCDIVRLARSRSPLSHPLAIFRKDVVLAVGGYPPLWKGQDYALWSLLIKKGYNLANLPDLLLKMRTGTGLVERRGWEYFKHEAKLLQFQRSIGFLGFYTFHRNLILKCALRLSPSLVKRLAYKYAR